MKALSKFLLTFLIGLTVGLTLSWRFTRPPAQVLPGGRQITQEHVSGAGRIRNEDFDFSGSEITFRSVSTGEAESFTRIPKGFVPEARAWMNAVHNLQASALAQLYDGQIRTSYSLQYLYRWKYVYAGGGPILGDGKGIMATAGACFW